MTRLETLELHGLQTRLCILVSRSNYLSLIVIIIIIIVAVVDVVFSIIQYWYSFLYCGTSTV